MPMTKREIVQAAADGSAQRLRISGRKFLLDMQTASAILAVDRGLKKPANRERFWAQPLNVMGLIAWKIVGRDVALEIGGGAATG